ncbi:hypothetical protein H7X65_01950 [Candidatus Parcubacteria bacterium]|nr:hypothetical protein [Candidatus Parcubacteria bacterium]
MTLKEFSHKHALLFFWATIILAIILLCSSMCRMHGGRGDMMRGGYDKSGKMMERGGQRQMMNPNNPNQPLINDTPGAAGTVETGAPVNPNVPVEVQ